MNNSAAFFIGWRYANSRKGNHFIAFINFFSVTGISLGLAALIIVSSVMNGFEGLLKQRILGLLPHFVVSAPVADLPANIQHSPLVNGVIPFAEIEAAIQSPSTLRPIIFQGIETQSFTQYSQVANSMLAGSINELSAGEYRIVIGRALAAELNVHVGEEVRILSAESTRYTLLGRMPSQRIFKVAGIFEMGSELDDSVAITHLHDLARLLRKSPEQLEHSRIFMHEPFEFQALRDSLDVVSLDYQDWRARQGPLFDAVKMEKNMMMLMLLLIIAVAAFNIVSALVMVVSEKQGDIAILQTQGMTKQQIWQVFIINGLSNGVKGTVIGGALGLLLAFNINGIISGLGIPLHLYLPEGRLPVLLEPWHLLLMVLFSLLLCFAASLYPAYRASQTRPAEALRYE